eukprot:CAMPEP_0175963436 /NCGR_PEP_ID=MMETSP0108-20121206/37016_1 /TAXON_ID=195067 ORGANISM="Goniomonas pacifica, Strain CCMP1869" /NCGR_SAMPLE_ID=MMETSP0108 /ASSEMBLY_ACC=CAM_ASM_000204 /LENGTH=250 /DNA_ID=CAMNT_0017291329 /DNA_START=277 /DNA_END=1029 /DNA_ORIENTATION=-
MPFMFHGAQFGARMALFPVEPGSKEFILYSPIEPTEAIVKQVKALGVVRDIVAPNLLHHLFVEDWKKIFPSARLFAAPGLPERRPDIHWDFIMDDQHDEAPWHGPWPGAPGVDYVVTNGHSFLREILLYHKESETVFVCDALQSFHTVDVHSKWMQWALALTMMLDRVTAPTDFKLTVSDPAAMNTAIRKVLEWKIERIWLHAPSLHPPSLPSVDVACDMVTVPMAAWLSGRLVAPSLTPTHSSSEPTPQ